MAHRVDPSPIVIGCTCDHDISDHGDRALNACGVDIPLVSRYGTTQYGKCLCKGFKRADR